jgi:hypothetical protein
MKGLSVVLAQHDVWSAVDEKKPRQRTGLNCLSPHHLLGRGLSFGLCGRRGGLPQRDNSERGDWFQTRQGTGLRWGRGTLNRPHPFTFVGHDE